MREESLYDSMAVPVSFDGAKWELMLQRQLPEVNILYDAWTNNTRAPWLTDDKLVYAKEGITSPAPHSHYVTINSTIASGDPRTPVFKFEANLDRLAFAVGDWVIVEATITAIRDTNFRLKFGDNGFKIAIDFDPIINYTDEYFPESTHTDVYSRTIGLVTGVIKARLSKQRLVITLRTDWLPDAGPSGYGLVFVAAFTIRAMTGWLVPSPNPWYPLAVFDIEPVKPEVSLAEAKRKESGEWEVVNPTTE